MVAAMNIRFSLLTLFAAFVLASCSSSSSRAPHPTVAMLDLQQPKGWFGMHWKSKKHRPQLVARALDGRGVRDQTLPGGMILTPGPHTVTLSARYRSLADLGKRWGDLGEKAGSRIDIAPSRFDRPVVINAKPGHEYLGHMRSRGEGFEYWVENTTEDEIVADTRR